MNAGARGLVMSKMSTSWSSVLSTITAYAFALAPLPSCQMKIECALFGTSVGSWVVSAKPSSGWPPGGSSGDWSPAPWMRICGLAGLLTS